nr:hypothetical protein [Vibrio sp. 23023]
MLNEVDMYLIEFIEKRYGRERGNRKKFLEDNPKILAPELSRWLKNNYKVNLATGEIYKPASKQVKL